VIGRPRHLQDDQLFECYLTQRGGDPLDPPTAEHLADCEPCGARYSDLTRFMDGLRTEGDAEIDVMFPAERLHAQQREIARRIEAVARPARVITFPGQAPRHSMAPAGMRIAPRFTAAAAAAGLVIGIALGATYGRESTVRTLRPPIVRDASDSPSRSAAIRQPDNTEDDVFLSELELALDRPRTRELVAFDAFTPHVREIRDTR